MASLPDHIKQELREIGLPESLITALDRLRRPSTKIDKTDEPSIAEQVETLYEHAEALVDLLHRRQNPALKALIRDAYSQAAAKEKDDTIFSVAVEELLSPCFHVLALRNLTERILKSPDLKYTQRMDRTDPAALYALKVAGAFLDAGEKLKTTETGLYVQTLAHLLGVSPSEAHKLALKAVPRAKALR